MCWFVPLGAAMMGSSTAAVTAAGLQGTAAAIGGMASLSALSTGMSFIGQRQQARAMQKSQDIAASQEAARFRREQTAIRRQEAQQEQAAAEESLAIQLRANQAASTAQVAAGEAGVSGTSVNELVNSYFQQEGDYRRSLALERGFQREATGAALVESGFRTQMETTRIRRPINKPSLIEGVVGVAEGLYGGAVRGYQFDQARRGIS